MFLICFFGFSLGVLELLVLGFFAGFGQDLRGGFTVGWKFWSCWELLLEFGWWAFDFVVFLDVLCFFLFFFGGWEFEFLACLFFLVSWGRFCWFLGFCWSLVLSLFDSPVGFVRFWDLSKS